VPTVLRLAGLRIVIYPNDHRPAHVHAVGWSGEAVFELNCPSGPVSLRESFGISPRDVRRIVAMLELEIGLLCAAWEKVHGDH
jgi:hypothetical protein